jgi:hypothetical protein
LQPWISPTANILFIAAFFRNSKGNKSAEAFIMGRMADIVIVNEQILNFYFCNNIQRKFFKKIGNRGLEEYKFYYLRAPKLTI